MTCTICAAGGIATTDASVEIIRDRDRDGLGSSKVYACDDCIAAGTDEDRTVMGVTADEWDAVQVRLRGDGAASVTTFASITDAQIKALRSEARAAGDLMQAAICERALYWATVSVEGLTEDEDRRIQNMTNNEAKSECVRVITQAEAQVAR